MIELAWIYWNADRLRDSDPIRGSKFGSGLMSFRASVVRNHRFGGVLRALPLGEDIDFCTRLPSDSTVIMTPRARATYDQSPIGRTADHWLKTYVQGKLYPSHRNRSCGVRNQLAHAWFSVGSALRVIFACVRRRSLTPWHAFHYGLAEAARLAALPD